MRKESDFDERRMSTRNTDDTHDGRRRSGSEVGDAHDRPHLAGAGADETGITGVRGNQRGPDSDLERRGDASRDDLDQRGDAGRGDLGQRGNLGDGDFGQRVDSGPRAEHAPLFQNQDTERFRSRWTEIQTNFVDEPRRSVEQANDLVAEVTDRLTSAFAKNRNDLERQWSAGDEVSTEDLRQTLQRYRSFFERLLSL